MQLPPVYKDAPPEPETILFPAQVRRCVTDGCGTILRLSNSGSLCSLCESKRARSEARESVGGIPRYQARTAECEGDL